ncbi:MAG: lysine--tRNA ligase [Gammaproteobacteria bacterium]|nr:lysine--tRNA ligase [Gammaproteobacteria bacterium]MDG2434980.1 lysine--tRNA ligase [Gammaproteobacteria bacterium]
MTEIKDDHNKLVDERRKKLLSLREEGFNYPISIEIDTTIKNLFEAYGESSREEVSDANKTVKIAGRMMAKRIMGKSSFSKVVDSSGSIQLFLNSKNLDEKMYNNFKTYDVGDIIWVEGVLFRTKTDELTVNVEKIEVLSKSLRPLPEKYHGLTDTETRYRKRYLDLIMSDDSKAVFQKRSKIVTTIRAFLDQKEILEVETPMMHPIAGGAIAKPFITHHNTLDRDFFLRIAPELYLKRLVVGGLHRVYEINRSFRNEGISTKHNPEFTMLELYLAYASYEEIMTLVEDMIIDIAMALNGSTTIQYQDSEYDLSGPYKRMTLEESVIQYNPKMDPKKLRDRETLLNTCKELGIKTNDDVTTGKLLFEIFEKTVEDNLIEPTFITSYPRDVSPLSRANDNDPWLVDRFEFFIAGSELANGFQELNDPDDQSDRFKAQVKERNDGDDEAMVFDQDYIEALEYGMPPTSGLGVGIDRLVMLFTESPSIRDVLLFPHMRNK